MARIDNKFVRNHFQWDDMREVDWGIVQQGLRSAELVLRNPDKFPKANFPYLEKQQLELTCFLLQAPL